MKPRVVVKSDYDNLPPPAGWRIVRAYRGPNGDPETEIVPAVALKVAPGDSVAFDVLGLDGELLDGTSGVLVDGAVWDLYGTKHSNLDAFARAVVASGAELCA